MRNSYVVELREAVDSYCYPPVTFDLETEKIKPHKNMKSVEKSIRSGLISGKDELIKQALVDIVFWGNANAGYAASRALGANEKLKNYGSMSTASNEFKKLATSKSVGIKEITSLRLPYFSRLSFASKLRMFLDPKNFVVLDMQIARIGSINPEISLNGIKHSNVSIHVSKNNIDIYSKWSVLCAGAARQLFPDSGLRAVDIERGLFKMSQWGNQGKASKIISALEKILVK